MARQDVAPPKILIEGGDFPDAVIGKTIQNQNITSFENCTIINKHYYSGQSTSQLDNEGTLPLLHRSSSEVIKYADDDEYKYLDNDVMICRQPLRKGTRVFQGRQLHCRPEEVGVGASRDVAIKIIRSSKNSAKEVDFLIKLTEHQNIVRILQSGKYPGPTDEMYIVMELCSKNLREYVLENRGKPFSFQKTTALVKQFVCGLQFIHGSKIAHGDLKPDNILFSMSENYLKISDFGMSKNFHSSHSRSSDSGVGTDGYRAPELYHEDAKASYESDMFSFGIITFFLFTNGKHPYGEDANDWSYNIRKNTPDLSEIVNITTTSIPGQLRLHKLLQHTLSSSPTARPTIGKVEKDALFRDAWGNVEDAGKLSPLIRRRFRHDPDMDDILRCVSGTVTVSRRSELSYVAFKRNRSEGDKELSLQPSRRCAVFFDEQ